MKSVLLISQTPPSHTGLGSAMRMGNLLQSLASRFDVTLLIVSMDPATQVGSVDERWRERAATVMVVNVADMAATQRPSPWSQALASRPRLMNRWPLSALARRLEPLRDRAFDVVLVVRLRLLPIWELLSASLGVVADQKVLDLDDIESRSHDRHRHMVGTRTLGRLGFVLEGFETAKLARAESEAARCMDKLIVCSIDDRALLARRIDAAKVAVVPNCIVLPQRLPLQPTGKPLRLLSVGALDYPPNADGVQWLVDEIIPAARARLGVDTVTLTVVGRNPPAWMIQKSQSGSFRLFGNVPSVAPYLEDCDVFLAPIRAGGGTRIKIIEAFGFGRPVISTTIGAEGLGAMPDMHLLIADDSQAFVEAIVRLMREPDLAQRLTDQARTLVEKSFTMAAFERSLAQAVP